MTRRANRRWLAAILAVGLFVGASAFATSASAASAVPWDDPNAVGYIGFCDTSGHQVRGGSTLTYPFATVAVSSTQPPSGYGFPSGRAVLYAFQPIQYVDPGDWSGMEMTGASAFTNNKAPMTQGLGRDHSLFNLTAAYPLHWKGLAQIRIYFTAPNKPEFETTYPAAVVQVTGKTWKQIGGGAVNCKAGKVGSSELQLPNPSKSLAPANATNQPTSKSSSGAGSSSSAAGSSSASSGAGQGGSASPAADAHASKGSSSTGVIIAVVVIVVIGGAGGFWARRRRAGLTG